MPLQVKASPVNHDDIKSINYCAETIQQRFGDVFPPEQRNDLNFFSKRVHQLMQTGIFFIVYLPALTKRGPIPIGLFQINPTIISGSPNAKAAVLRNVCLDKEIWGQGLGTSLLLEVLRIASEMDLNYLIGHVFKTGLIGTLYKLAEPISGRIANSNYLGISTELLLFNVTKFKEFGLQSGLSQFGLYRRRRHSSPNIELQPKRLMSKL